jgi:iron(III) transport system ATP-binding protein
MEITLEGITKVYEGSESDAAAVADVSVRIASGELFFLLGPSGCGKTTLLRMIAGLLPPTSGRVLFAGRDVTDLPVEKRNTAMVFQSYALWPHMTVQANVEFGPKMRRMGRSQRRSVAGEQLERVQMLEFARRKPNQLSGGQQQRVALARALAGGSDCLLLDEPLSNLDAQLRLQMRGELRKLVKSTGVTGVYVTHDQKEALSMADRIAVMNAGRIVQIGAPEELYDRPGTRFVAEFLGEANFVAGRIADPAPPVKIETALGTLLTGEMEPAAIGTEVTCCIRPERIAISQSDRPAASGDESRLPAVVESSTYLGEIRQYVCSVGEDKKTRWKVFSLSEVSGPRPGDRVVLRVSGGDVAVLRC